MNKYYLIFLLICLSLQNTKNSKSSIKNLRKLDPIPVQFNKVENYRYDTADKKLKFTITLSDATGLTDGSTYSLTIAYLTGKETSTCTYQSSLTLNCEYQTEQPYYGSIKLLNNNGPLPTDTINLQLSSVQTLQQTVELTYKNGYVKFSKPSSNIENLVIIYIEETNLEDNSFYELDVKISEKFDTMNCTYSTNEACLKCKYNSGSDFLVQLVNEQNTGSIKWKNDQSYDFEKTFLLNLTMITNIYGYNSDFIDDKWQFYVRAGNLLYVNEPKYYYRMTVLLGKSDETNVKAEALCYMKSSYGHSCTVDKIVEPAGGKQEKNDLLYIAKEQTVGTLSFDNDLLAKLPDKKQVSRLITFKFVKAYGLKYNSGSKVWEFKISVETSDEISNIVRNGLNVTIDLFSSAFNNYTGSCIYNDKILSCVSDKLNQGLDDEVYKLDLQRNFQLNHVPTKVGSVTWSNAGEYDDKLIRIPLETELTFVLGYDMEYEQSKWSFKLKAKTNNLIAKNNLIYLDILYGTDISTIAECSNNNDISKGYTGTFTCECSSPDGNQILKINNLQKDGSVTWLGATAPFSIRKALVFKYIQTKNLILNPSTKLWSFEIQFEDVNNVLPTMETNVDYKTYFYYSYYPDTTRILESTATCNKKEAENIFSCTTSLVTSVYNKYIFFMKEISKIDDENRLRWNNMPNTYDQIPITTDLTFVSGLINNNNHYLNLTVQIPTGYALPIEGKVIIDIIKDSSPTTLECDVVKADSILQCPIKENSIAYSFTNIKTGLTTVTWKNTDTNYIFDLYDTLNFISANNLEFVNNKWQFNLKVTKTIPSNVQMIIDVLYNGVASTATCNIVESTILCKCDFLSQSQNSLVQINNVKSENSTITWESLNEPQGIIIDAQLDVVSVKHLAYERSKWEFKMNLQNCNLPLNSAVKIDILYNSASETATCFLKSQNILTCVPDRASQSTSDTFIISHTKDKGSTTYKSSAESLQIEKSQGMTYSKASSLTLNNNNWIFKIYVSTVSLIENNDNISLDFKFNGQNKKVSCKYIESGSDKYFDCSIPNVGNDDRIILINDRDNQDLVWSELENDVQLCVAISVEFENCYGGFYDGKWLFNIKYKGTVNYINNYASIVVSNGKIAYCKIISKYLLCELNYDNAKEGDNLSISNTQTGSITFYNSVINKGIIPISINIKNYVINDFKYYNDEDKFTFKIKGNLNGNTETEIASNTLSKISLLVNDDLLNDVVCFTNEVNNSPVTLTCEKKNMVINIKTDKLYIIVDSNGKSGFITFNGATDKIAVDLEDNTKNNSGNNLGFMMKINAYLILLSLILLI